LLLRKWALVLLFLPGIAFSVILVIGLLKSSRIAAWAIAMNVLFVSATVAVPIALLCPASVGNGESVPSLR
jgi:hypothetical protein